MIELVTETNKTQLNDKQLQAIDLILIGNTDDQVAKNGRTTNHTFKAELNRRTQLLVEKKMMLSCNGVSMVGEEE